VPDMETHNITSTSPPQVTMATDGHFGADGSGGTMQHEDSIFADTNMADAGDMYGLGDTLGQAPYYGIPQIDPQLSALLDDGMGGMDLQSDSNDVSPTQAYAGDVSSAARTTPANRPKRSLSKHNKKGKQKQAAVVEDPDSQVPSEDEDEEDTEQPEDESDEFTPEPAVVKRSAKRTPSKRTPKRAARKSAGSSRRKSAAKPQDEIPFNRLRRAPKNGIVEARPIARCYEECDEADKALLDLRERELKTWKEIRVVWEEMTGHKTGNSTLPNRYE
jgi:pyruvate/2-oxoglutarate dehydrogenase complex dihydrolipoamide acyltransferase (E2) component